MKRQSIFQNKSFLLRMVIGLFAMLCASQPANAEIQDGFYHFKYGAPCRYDSTTWIKKNGYTIMHTIPLLGNANKPEDSYCVVYFEGKGVYEGYYRTGYTAQSDAWYIFDIGLGLGKACLTAGELYSVTPAEYLAAGGILNSFDKKTIWLGQEYPLKKNTLTDAQVLKIFQSEYGLQSNKTGTKKMKEYYGDKVFFPAVNIGQGIHHYDMWGNPVYATIYQGDFNYYGECTANMSVSGWNIKGDSVFFHFGKPTITSTKFYIDPSRYNPMNFNDAALKAYKYQDNVALSQSNVDDKFKKKFQADVNEWTKELQSNADRNNRFKITESRPFSTVYEKYGKMYCSRADQEHYPDPAMSYDAYINEMNKISERRLADRELTKVLKDIYGAPNLCLIRANMGFLEIMANNRGDGKIGVLEYTLANDSGRIGWRLSKFEQISNSQNPIYQFKKKNARAINDFKVDNKWPDLKTITEAHTFAEVETAMQLLPRMLEEAAALSIYYEADDQYYRDDANFTKKDSLKNIKYGFKNRKNYDTMYGLKESKHVSYGFYRFENMDDLLDKLTTCMENFYILHEYALKAKSPDAKMWSQKMAKAKTRDEMISALEIQVPQNMKEILKEKIKSRVETISPSDLKWFVRYQNRQQDEWTNRFVQALELEKFPEYKPKE